MDQKLTLYMHIASPFSHRALIALEEIGIDVEKYHIDLDERKPAWYTEKVNPLGKIPTLVLGDQRAPDQPSEQAVKIPESLVIVEYLADLFPDGRLLPIDPIERARARAFATSTNNVMYPAWWACNVYRTSKNLDPIFEAFDYIQSLLPSESDASSFSTGTVDVDARAPGLYAIGDRFSVADVSVAPWFPRFELLLKHGFFGHFDEEAVKNAGELYRSARYDRLRRYAEVLKNRPSIAKTFEEEPTVAFYKWLFSLQ